MVEDNGVFYVYKEKSNRSEVDLWFQWSRNSFCFLKWHVKVYHSLAVPRT